MKRIISMILISLMLISISSCKSKQQAEDAKNTLAAAHSTSKIEGATIDDFPPGEYEGEIFLDSEVFPLKSVDDMVRRYVSSDVFVGKVVDVQIVKPMAPLYHLHRHAEDEKNKVCGRYYRTDRNYEEVFLLDSNLYLYTVEIEKSINSIFTTEKTTIQVINAVPYGEERFGYKRPPHEVGERYIMGGRLWQYGEKTVLYEEYTFTSKVGPNGELEGFGSSAAEIMNQIGTLENFIANKEIAKIFEKEFYVNQGYVKDYNLSTNLFKVDSKDKNVQKLISDGKKALPIDSKFKMPVKTDVIGDLSDDANRVPTNAELKIQQGIAE